MQATDSRRVSIPFGTSITKVNEEALKKHSFDLIHFPAYLACKAARCVRVEITSDRRADSHLMGWFEDDQTARSWMYASLIADDNGVQTDSDDFYLAVHAAFAAAADGRTYIGFTRCGSPPDAPLFGIGLMFNRYGHGIYKAGDMLPTRWPESMAAAFVTLL